jgi:hypothetical protein
MEKDKRHSVLTANKKKFVASLALSVILSGVAKDSRLDGHEVYQYSPLPQEDFKTLNIYHSTEVNSPDIKIPYSKLEIPTPSPLALSKKQTERQNSNNDLTEVISKMKEHKNIFSDKYVQDVKMYYPIYKAVGDKYHMDWYLLWIVHENETGASAGWRGFVPESYYKGAMQRDPNTWDQDFVNNAAKGLEDLAKLPQRHQDDWKEIAAGAAILDRNIKHYQNLGKDKAVFNALRLYSTLEAAKERFALYKRDRILFND